MAPRTKKTGLALLPSTQQLAGLSEEKTKLILDVVNKVNERETWHGTIRMVIAGCCFSMCVASFTYLVMKGHEKAAAVVLGVTVLGVVGQMINARI